MKTILFLFYAILIIWTPAIADDSLSQEPTPKSQELISNSILEFTLPPFELQEIQTYNEIYHKIHVQEWATTSEPGVPELPVKGILLQVPPSGNIEIRILESIWETYQDSESDAVFIPPVPRLTESEDGSILTEYIKNPSIYNHSAFFPKVPAEIGSRKFFRDTPVARLMIYPFQWNPVTKELRYCKKMRIEVKFETGDLKSETRNLKSETGKDPFGKLKEKIIFNYRNAGVRSQESEFRSQNLGVRSQNLGARIRIPIQQEGVYRITSEDLINAGLDAGAIAPATFQLFNMGNAVAVKTVTEDNNYYIEFFGKGIDTSFTDTNVYWLEWGDSSGKQIGKIDGTLTGEGEEQNYFDETLHIESNYTTWIETPGAPETDYFFQEKITVTSQMTKQYSINIDSPVSDQGEITVRVGFQGRSPVSHHTIVKLNNTQIGDALWKGDIAYVQEMTASSSLLIPGTNTITIEFPFDTDADIDIIYLNWIEITYPRKFEAVQDKLCFTVEGDSRLEMSITNLSQPEDVRIFDITEPENVKEIINPLINPNGEVFFEDEVVGKKTYYLFTEKQITQPDNITLWQSSDLKNSSNSADYILITAKEFLSSVEPLCQLRQRQGLRVKSVCVEDIFDEFNDGLYNPQAIRDFLQYAYENWESPAPSYILLVGDANMDYRNYFHSNKENKVPPHLTATSFDVRPDDNWYVCVQGDDLLPEMMIGRISGATPNRVAEVINKITSYETNTTSMPKSILFVADEGEEYEQVNEKISASLPDDFTVNKIYWSMYGTAGGTTPYIISSLDSGQLITNYVGHGGYIIWGGLRSVFRDTDIASLNNGNKLPFIICMSCSNGHFAQSSRYSISEEFVMAQNKGAMGVFSSAGLVFIEELEILDKETFSILFEQQNRMLGSIITEAKIGAYAKGVSDDIMKLFNLLGDPAAALNWDDPNNPRNHSPLFTPGADQIVNEDAGLITVEAWATEISPGDENESEQNLTFVVITDNDALFAEKPVIDSATGNLTFTPAEDAYGTANITVTLKDDGGTENGGIDTSESYAFTININPLNDAPKFTLGANQIVNEDAGLIIVEAWATEISAGGLDESDQNMTFEVNTDNDSLFAKKPMIDPATGNLTFTPAEDAYGVAKITVTLKDDGGTENGGIDTSESYAFTININPLNDAPLFTPGADQIVNEDAGLITVEAWATEISTGGLNESDQNMTFEVNTDNDTLFAEKPVIDPATGNLTFMTAENAYGAANITVTLKDDGGTENGGVDTSYSYTFTITVNPVNDAPDFIAGENQTVFNDFEKHVIEAWATGIYAGAENESEQNLAFHLVLDNNTLFSEKPVINPLTGDLTFSPAKYAYGTAKVIITLKDDGGTENSGTDTSKSQVFTITVKVMPGDMNGDSIIDMEDLIMGLQIVAGIKPTQPVYIEADMNFDRKIGMEEVVYIFQKILINQ